MGTPHGQEARVSDLPHRISQLVERQDVLDARISALENLLTGELRDVWETFADIATVFQAQVKFNADIVGILAPAFPESDLRGSAAVLVDLDEALKNRKGGE